MVCELLSKLKRCLKCQNFRHYVADCKVEIDRCAHCSGKHQTMQCIATDATEIECVNCTDNTKGHGATDRNCPTYLKEKSKLHKCIPENKYRFFPTNNPCTWQLLNQPESYTNDQECTWQQGADWAATARNAQADEAFTNNWKTIWHCRRQSMEKEQNQDREQYEQHQNREGYEALHRYSLQMRRT